MIGVTCFGFLPSLFTELTVHMFTHLKLRYIKWRVEMTISFLPCACELQWESLCIAAIGIYNYIPIAAIQKFSCCNLHCCSKNQATHASSIKIEVYSNGKTYRPLYKVFFLIQICRYSTNITQWAVV